MVAVRYEVIYRNRNPRIELRLTSSASYSQVISEGDQRIHSYSRLDWEKTG
ncbi:hypothetical protein [Methanothermobacter sp.]|uniref:hypothetical protein n=1 Tax=Methanothermobacter sp. TaxID=1884223 RepID=UPI003C78B1AF